jgi:uncharacterized membrane protein SirB2
MKAFRGLVATRRGAWGLVLVGAGLFVVFALTPVDEHAPWLVGLWFALKYVGMFLVILGAIVLVRRPWH